MSMSHDMRDVIVIDIVNAVTVTISSKNFRGIFFFKKIAQNFPQNSALRILSSELNSDSD
jgi:hypothetical protein